MPPKQNQKAVAAREKQAKLAEERARQKAAEDERMEEREWSKGANTRAERRQQESEEKAAERARLAAEKKRIQEEEEAGAKARVKPAGAKSKQSIPPWEAALMDGAKKGKGGKKAGSAKAAAPAPARAPREEKPEANYPLTVQDMELPENLNRMEPDVEAATGIDAALDLMSSVTIGGEGTAPDRHPEKRAKAAYKAYEERELARLREEQPGLKLSQYKERIFEAWKKSPENPRNQERAA